MALRLTVRTAVAVLVLGVCLRAQEQTASLGEQVLAELGLGVGAHVADVGAGKGRRGIEFARAVGPDGRVVLEEIDAEDVENWKKGEPAKFEQIEFVLGGVADPGLSPASFDLVFMELVFHHITQPREMLAGVRRALKPGGYFVVMDIDRGPLLDRVPFSERGDKHHPSAETAVVRLCRESGFSLLRELDLRGKQGTFLLAFQRTELRDAHPHRATVDELVGALPDLDRGTVGVILSGPGRDTAIQAIEQRWDGVDILEIALDEWLLPDESLDVPDSSKAWRTVRTHGGVPAEPLPELTAVVFIDSFHQVFYDRVLLNVLQTALEPGGSLVVLDHPAQAHLPRMSYSHRRGIWGDTAAAQLSSAGFQVTRVRTSVDRVQIEARTEETTSPQAPTDSAHEASQLLEQLIGDLELPEDAKVTLVGDHSLLTLDNLDAAGFAQVWHSTAIGWEGFQGDATAKLADRNRGPFPLTPSRRKASLVIVCDYQDHPEPRWILDPSMSFNPLEDGGFLILASRWLPRSDRLLDTLEEIVAIRPALSLVREVQGAEVGHDEEVFWVFRFEAEEKKKGPEKE